MASLTEVVALISVYLLYSSVLESTPLTDVRLKVFVFSEF